MRRVAPWSLLAVVFASPAIAGEEVLYEPAPDWVDVRTVTAADEKESDPVVLLDQQARIETGILTTYVDTAFALDSPEALTRFGTLSANWLPDKGDLRIHKVELIRKGETVNLLEGGTKFEVLRRERGLERRLLNGALTATLNVSGAQLGDIIRLAYSTTSSDQAMGDDVQWQSQLLADPFPLKSGRVSVSWPKDLPVTRLFRGDNTIPDPVEKDGFMVWAAELPVEEADDKPGDAPSRYTMRDMMQATTYKDWSAVSRNMAQYYEPQGTIAEGSDLAAQVAKIAAATDDPLTRAALAVKVVQDDVSYLLNGLNGGNYLPQSPEETWEKRFGDCKAKSLLLLAMLTELGIEAETTLIRTRGGDILPEVAPMPGNFDHIIVRAVINGTNYWLDGTDSGTRLETMDTVPRFFYALPLREGGAELEKLDQRAKTLPDRIINVTFDHTAGVRLPSLLDIDIEYRGRQGARWRSVAEQNDEDTIEDRVDNAVYSVIGSATLVDHKLEYDAETGIARITARGVQNSRWMRDRLEYEFDPPAQAAKSVGFNTDRARAAWRDIPLRLNGPINYESNLKVLLPTDNGDFEIDGEVEVAQTIGGVELGSKANLESNGFAVSQHMRSVMEELPADQILVAKRELRRFNRKLPTLRSGKDVREPWEYFGEGRALLAPMAEIYSQAVANAEDDEIGPLLDRAQFYWDTYDFAAALKDVEAAEAIEASRQVYLMRGYLRRETGDFEGALADYQLSEDLEPNGSTYAAQIELLALLGKPEDGIDLAEDYGEIVDSRVDEADTMASALAWNGQVEKGIAVLEDLKAQRPGDGTLLNAICWQAGIWDKMTPERLETCVSAVEKSDYSAAALDSRAMAFFRLGKLDDALADVDAALLASPGQAASRLLKGIILKKKGDKSWKEEVKVALAMEPSMRARYEAWGLKF